MVIVVSSRVRPAAPASPDEHERALRRSFLNGPYPQAHFSFTKPARGGAVFSADVMSILAAGTSLIVGTVGPDGEPRATRAFALTLVDAEADVVRLVLSADDPVVVAHLDTGVIAITAADVRTLRSVQLKGRIIRVEPTSPHDEALVAEHSGRFFQAIHETDGHDLSAIRQLLPLRTVSVEVSVEELFDQTPGPDAGRRVVAP
jgi:hypothetical protein